MPSTNPPRIALGPESAPSWQAEAIRAGGGHVVPLKEAEGLIWADPRDPQGLEAALAIATEVRWVNLPYAGIEPFLHLINGDRVWTCGKGVYAEPVAEHVVALALAGMRGVVHYARESEWAPPLGRNLLG